MTNLIILALIASMQGFIQVCDLSYMLYETNRFQLSLHDFQALRFLLQIPWIIKPIWGYCTDMLPIRNKRRKPYLIIFAILSFLLENMMGLFEFDQKTAYLLVFLISISHVVCNVIAEAILVDLSHEQHASRNVSIFFGMRALGSLTQVLLSHNLPLHRNNFQLISFCPLIIAVLACFFQERSLQHLISSKVASAHIRNFLLQPQIYRPILFIFFFMATPSPSTSMFYFYVNSLKLNDEFFTTLRYMYSLCSIAAISIYYAFRKASFQKVFGYSNLLYFLASISSLLLITGINQAYNIPDHLFCMWDNIIMQTLQEINTLPVLVLACRMCPLQIEGTIYSIIMATINLANVLSKELGILLTMKLGITNNDFSNLWLLILICNIVSLLPMPFIGAIDEKAVQLSKKQMKEELNKTV